MRKNLNEQIVKMAARAKTRQAATQQSDLFETDSLQSPATQGDGKAKEDKPASGRGLLPVRHPTRDFFLCDMFDYALKDDGASMEVPIFTLATKPDLTVWHWQSKDGDRSITVTPSVQGRATQFDKDVLIYIVSQMTEALNRNRFDAKNRVVRFTVYDYLVSTNKPTGVDFPNFCRRFLSSSL